VLFMKWTCCTLTSFKASEVETEKARLELPAGPFH